MLAVSRLWQNYAMSETYDVLVDTSGLKCPEPVMMLHNAVRAMQVGAVIKVLATDPSTTRDIPRFCEFLGHELMAREEIDGTYLYFIRRGS